MATGEALAPEAAMIVTHATSRLEGIINAVDAAAIQPTTLQDLIATAREIERNQKEVLNLGRLQSFFTSLKNFSAAMGPLCDAKTMA